MLLSLLACASHAPPPPAVVAPPPASPPPADKVVTLLAINDVYRIEGTSEGGGLARVRALRSELEKTAPDLLFLHAGDFLYPSIMSRTYAGEQMVDVLNRLDGDPSAPDPRMLVVFGNHEFDSPDAAALDARIDGSQFRWLHTNITFTDAIQSPNLADTAMMESGGVKVGIFGLTIGSNPQPYVASFADPVDTARTASAALRAQGAQVVVGLTHRTVEDDAALLDTLGKDGPDLIIGGHEHRHQEVQAKDGRWVLKADSEALSATVARVTVHPDGTLDVSHQLVPLGADAPADPTVKGAVDAWVTKHDAVYCTKDRGLPAGCLDDVMGVSKTDLVATSAVIRRYETGLGDWIADVARSAFPKATVAFINAGTLRLDEDIPAGEPITREDVEGLFAYPCPLRLLQIDGATLTQVVAHSISDWTGRGHFLQIAGFAFRHDTAAGTAGPIALLGPTRVARSKEPILAVTNGYVGGGGDGYTMLANAKVITTGPDLKDLVIKALAAAGKDGIAPVREGRICVPDKPECLAP
jgi:5'-nucleotidase